MGHWCRICGRVRANERFSRKGHRNHICRDCKRLPRAVRDAADQRRETYCMLRQRNISEKNIRRLEALMASPTADVAAKARLVREVALVHPRKRRRLRFLARERPDLLGALEANDLVYDWDNWPLRIEDPEPELAPPEPGDDYTLEDGPWFG